ncbi:SANT/Myb domain [Sesbania bispinosa]|nr:SANT/Myb domain [Sesbania bispinosa]
MEFESLYPPNRFDEEMYSTKCTSEENIVLDVMKHYDEFVEEVTQIEAAVVPGYPTSSFCMEMVDNLQGHDGCKKSPATAKGSDKERKKVVRWTKEEHERFLMGLKNYGKGHWKNIARYSVITKTPTQVASHAQKYLKRQKLSGGKDNKRRSSIHDITTDNLTEPTTNSGQDKPILFNESLMPIVQPEGINHLNEEPLVEVFNPNYESLMTNVQPEGINHHNVEPIMEVFNPNYDEMFMFPSSDIYSETLKFQGQQDLDKCLFHHAYAQQNAQGFGTTSDDFNKDAVFGFW